MLRNRKFDIFLYRWEEYLLNLKVLIPGWGFSIVKAVLTNKGEERRQWGAGLSQTLLSPSALFKNLRLNSSWIATPNPPLGSLPSYTNVFFIYNYCHKLISFNWYHKPSYITSRFVLFNKPLHKGDRSRAIISYQYL
jgi:hypothetical protein